MIVRRIARKLPQRFELEDLCSIGYLGLIHAADHYRPALHGGAPFGAYAHKVIRGHILDSIRHDSRGHSEAAAVVDSADIDAGIDAGRVAYRVAAAVVRLPARERAVIEGHYQGGLNLAACGETLGVGKSQTSRLHTQALAVLRARLAG